MQSDGSGDMLRACEFEGNARARRVYANDAEVPMLKDCSAFRHGQWLSFAEERALEAPSTYSWV